MTLCAALGACSIDRAEVEGDPSALPGHDASVGEIDASRGDVDADVPGPADPELDGGPLVDAGPSEMRDAGTPLDAGPPVEPIDAGTDAGPVMEHCDGRDEDADGRVDEDTTDCGCDRVLRADGRSYLFCTEHRTFDEARAYCMARGYDLVVIDDEAENTFVREEQRTRGNDFLLGLDDRGTERTFVWVDGRIAWRNGDSLLFTAWASGQPDDFWGEDCVQMRGSGQWNDVDCGNRSRHVCESAAP